MEPHLSSITPLLVTVAENYGQTTVYPACKRSRVFAEIAGTKSLTEATRNAIKKLGYVFTIAKPTIEL